VNKNIKKIILSTICFLTFITIFSQINIGKSRSPINLYVSNLEKEEFNFLKTTITYFVVPEKLNFDELKEIINEIWTFNKIEFISEKEYSESKFVQEGNTIILLIDDNYVKTLSNFGDVNKRTVGEYITFRFKMFSCRKVKKNKKGKIKKDIFDVAEIFFTPSLSYRNKVVSSSNRNKTLGFGLLKKSKKNKPKKVNEPKFYNFNLGYIKNYFQTLNTKLTNKENLKIRDGILNKEKLKILKNKTLYTPNWILKKYNALNAKQSKIREPKELFEKYKYKYSVISNSELNAKILNGEDFYYLMHTQFNQVKIVSIINSNTGEIIYLKEDNSYNIKSSDLKKISGLIN